MKAIPYSCQNIIDEDVEAVTAALRSDFLTQGPRVPAFESAFAKLHEVPFAVAVSNATAGLHIGCLALGVGPGSRVWTSPNSFVASANCALYCGATIDFVDIDPETRNMSTDALADKLARADKAGVLPHVVIPVHFAGLPCDLREIRQLADRYGFKILEDASHATGASYQGRPIGHDYADASVFSFHAVKIVTSGEGGMVTTRDPSIARKLQLLRSHGITRDSEEMSGHPDGPWYYQQLMLGYNYRLTDFQAALGISQLERLQQLHARRLALASRYDAALARLPLRLPVALPDRCSAVHLYVVEVDETACRRSRLEVFESLRRQGIGVNVHYIPIHTQPYFRKLGFRSGDFPHCERYYARAVTIPLFPAMSDEEQERVIDSLSSVLA